MAQYLVTGGCGFIGSHLVEALVASHHNVRVLDDLSTGRRENVPPQAEIIIGTITDDEAVEKAMRGVDGCFHLAAIASVERSNTEWVGTHEVNLGGTVRVFDAARRAMANKIVPVVYASSAAVYGDSNSIPLAETSEIKPLSAYGVDKFACELHGGVAARVHGVPTTGLRLFNIYGPRQDPNSPYSGVISIFAKRIIEDSPVTIFGDGEQVRDFVYVSDAVRSFIAAMARLTSTIGSGATIYNVCTGQPINIVHLAKILGALSGRSPRIEFAPERPGDIRISIGSGERAAKVLGVRPEMPLEKGLAITLASLRVQT